MAKPAASVHNPHLMRVTNTDATVAPTRWTAWPHAHAPTVTQYGKQHEHLRMRRAANETLPA
eukprot:6539434-Prymnesium_polylepis.1